MNVSTNQNQIDEFLNRAVAEVLPTRESLRDKLLSGDKLRIYNGIDPTSPSIHLGNAIILRKMQDLVEMGHEVIFLIGSFTAQIGDPSDKDSVRPTLTKNQVEQNFKDYQKLASKILDFDKVRLEYNGKWHEEMKLPQFMEILSKVTHQQLIERDLFQKRLAEKKDLFMHEMMYPILQGWDSVQLDVDLEMGGTDQIFNMLMGRKLQKLYGKREKWVLAVNLVPGTDGRKMSKSYGNVINLDDNPNDMYGKVMSINDDLIWIYFEAFTKVDENRLRDVKNALTDKKNHAMNLKKELAREIVTLYHGPTAATQAEASFEATVQRGETPEEMTSLTWGRGGLPAGEAGEKTLLDLVLFAKPDLSRSEAKRLIEQGGVELNEQKNKDPKSIIEDSGDIILKVGKRDYYKVQR